MYRSYVLRFWKIAYGYNIAVSTLSRQVRNMLIALLLYLYINKTMFCRAKNKLKRGVRIKSDLRKSRYDLLKRANDYVNEVPSIKFFYAGVNCRLKAKFNDENRKDIFSIFDDLRDIEDMETLLVNLSVSFILILILIIIIIIFWCFLIT